MTVFYPDVSHLLPASRMPRQSAFITACIDWIACDRMKDFKYENPDTTEITADMIRCSNSFDGAFQLLTDNSVNPISCCEDLRVKVFKKLITKLDKSRKNAYAIYYQYDDCWIDEYRISQPSNKYWYDGCVCAFLISKRITEKHLRNAVEKQLKNKITDVKLDINDYIK